MIDPVVSAPASNQQLAEAKGQFGFGKIISAFLAGAIASYVMNWFSLHGVNFEMMASGIDIPSETIKSTLEGFIISFFVWATPQHFIAAIVDGIRGGKSAWKQIVDALNQPTQ